MEDITCDIIVSSSESCFLSFELQSCVFLTDDLSFILWLLGCRKWVWILMDTVQMEQQTALDGKFLITFFTGKQTVWVILFFVNDERVSTCIFLCKKKERN